MNEGPSVENDAPAVTEADAKKFFMAGMSLGQRYPGATPEIEWRSLWSRYQTPPGGAEYDRKRLHDDPWLMTRIDRALDAIRHAEYAGLETALDLIAFAEDVLDHYEPRVIPPGKQARPGFDFRGRPIPSEVQHEPG